MSSVVKNYQTLLQDINAIALSCKRNPDSIKLVVVTKNHTWDEIAPLYEAGCRDFGENRLQEALEKIDIAPKDINWHFIGTLQKNKVRKVVELFSMIHSVDTPALAQKISQCSFELGIVSAILLEVNTSGEVSKHGLSPEEWRSSYESVQSFEGIRIDGLMTMAPLTEDEVVIRNAFQKLRLLRDELSQPNSSKILHDLSMGMTHDYKLAIEEGATLLRIGTAIFS